MKRFGWIIAVVLFGVACGVALHIIPNNMPCLDQDGVCASGDCQGVCKGRDIGAACSQDNECNTNRCVDKICAVPICEDYCTSLSNGTPARLPSDCFSGKLLAGHCVGRDVGDFCDHHYQCATGTCDVGNTQKCMTSVSGRLMAGSACTLASSCVGEGYWATKGGSACNQGFCRSQPGGTKFLTDDGGSWAGFCQNNDFIAINGGGGFYCPFPKTGCDVCVARTTTCPVCQPGQMCNGTTRNCDEQTNLPQWSPCHLDSNCAFGLTCQTNTCQPEVAPPPPPAPVFDYTITAANPTPILVQGNSTNVTINTSTLNGVAAEILTVGTPTVAPTGPTVTASVSSVSSTGAFMVTIATASGLATGPYVISVPTSGGGQSHAVSIYLTVNAPVAGDFTPSAATTVTVAQGSSATTPVTITWVSGTPTVSLSATTPTGVSAGFNPATVTLSSGTASSTLTLNVANSVAVGSYPGAITITGTSGSNTHSVTIGLVVTAPPVATKVHPATCSANSECRSGTCFSGVCAPDPFRMCNLYTGTSIEVYGATGQFRSLTIGAGDGCWYSDPTRNDAAAVEVGTLNYLCQQFTFWWTTAHQCTLVGNTGRYGVTWNNGMTALAAAAMSYDYGVLNAAASPSLAKSSPNALMVSATNKYKWMQPITVNPGDPEPYVWIPPTEEQLRLQAELTRSITGQ